MVFMKSEARIINECIVCGNFIDICELCNKNFADKEEIYCGGESHICKDCFNEEVNENGIK